MPGQSRKKKIHLTQVSGGRETVNSCFKFSVLGSSSFWEQVENNDEECEIWGGHIPWMEAQTHAVSRERLLGVGLYGVGQGWAVLEHILEEGTVTTTPPTHPCSSHGVPWCFYCHPSNCFPCKVLEDKRSGWRSPGHKVDQEIIPCSFPISCALLILYEYWLEEKIQFYNKTDFHGSGRMSSLGVIEEKEPLVDLGAKCWTQQFPEALSWSAEGTAHSSQVQMRKLPALFLLWQMTSLSLGTVFS